MMCLAPLLLVGYAWTVQTDWHRSADRDAPYVQLQSCKTGLGVHAKASAAPWGAGGLHYGFTWEPVREVELTVQPQVGLSYFNSVQRGEYRQIGRFELGLAVMASWRRAHVSVEYTHLSNGEGWKPTNVGMDLVAVQTGWRW
jgi:Lipid A 3-O-deacylase (PagL)